MRVFLLMDEFLNLELSCPRRFFEVSLGGSGTRMYRNPFGGGVGLGGGGDSWFSVLEDFLLSLGNVSRVVTS